MLWAEKSQTVPWRTQNTIPAKQWRIVLNRKKKKKHRKGISRQNKIFKKGINLAAHQMQLSIQKRIANKFSLPKAHHLGRRVTINQSINQDTILSPISALSNMVAMRNMWLLRT